MPNALAVQPPNLVPLPALEPFELFWEGRSLLKVDDSAGGVASERTSGRSTQHTSAPGFGELKPESARLPEQGGKSTGSADSVHILPAVQPYIE